MAAKKSTPNGGLPISVAAPRAPAMTLGLRTMPTLSHPAEDVPPGLLERVLAKLGFRDRPPPSLEGLRATYAAWCQHVPFDNVRKLIHLRSGEVGPFPGDTAEDFFEAWLRFGTGATCWGGHTGLHALLSALGFAAVRGYGTMLLAPDIPPNHATVAVACEGASYLVDASMLHGEPLELSASERTRITHPAWGVEARPQGAHHQIRFRPIHMPKGLDCRIDRMDVPLRSFQEFHEGTRPWSPFNYQLYARINRGDCVLGIGFGRRYVFRADGSVQDDALDPADRQRMLIEEIGLAEELVARLPLDIPTPPPPGSGSSVGSG